MVRVHRTNAERDTFCFTSFAMHRWQEAGGSSHRVNWSLLFPTFASSSPHALPPSSIRSVRPSTRCAPKRHAASFRALDLHHDRLSTPHLQSTLPELVMRQYIHVYLSVGTAPSQDATDPEASQPGVAGTVIVGGKDHCVKWRVFDARVATVHCRMLPCLS